MQHCEYWWQRLYLLRCFAACEAAFRWGSSCVFQLQLGRERDGVPVTRDYLGAEKERLRAREAEVLEPLLASTEGAF